MTKHNKGLTLSPRGVAVLAALIVALVAGGVALGINWGRLTGQRAAASAFAPDIDPNAERWDGGALPNAGGPESEEEPAGIQIPGYPSITIPADTTDVTLALLNPEGNPCYFTFELVLSDTDEVLYTSGMVPPGEMISDVTLSRPLAAGEYDATIRITTASLEDGSAMNGANVETVLVVQ